MTTSRYSLQRSVTLVALCLVALPALAQDDAVAGPVYQSPGLRAALGMEQAFADVASATLPGIAGVSAYRRVPGAGGGSARTGWQQASRDGHPGYERVAVGSAFVVSEDGYLMTARSALVDPTTGRVGERIEIELLDEKLPGRVIGADPTIDLAVLKVESERPLKLSPLPIAQGLTSVGHWAIAIGDPPGPGTTFAVGMVSARPERECYQEERSATLMQSSAVVPPGGYGGPLLNIRGEVTGINLPPPPGEELRKLFGTDSNFALPIALAMTIYEPLLARESQTSPWLGISVLRIPLSKRTAPILSGGLGILIDDVFDPSPASRAGIEVGDILLRMDREEMTSIAQFQRWLYLNGIGKPVRLQIYRDEGVIWKDATIEERPPSAITR